VLGFCLMCAGVLFDVCWGFVDVVVTGGSVGYCIYTSDVDNGEFNNNYFVNCPASFYFYSATNLHCYYNIFDTLSTVCFYIGTCTNISVDQNIGIDLSNLFILTTSTSVRLSIITNFLTHATSNCISVTDSIGTIISGNNLVGANADSGVGIRLYACEKVNVYGNFVSSFNNGVWLYNTVDCIVNCNISFGHTAYGITITNSGCSRTLCSNNHLYGNGTGALYDVGTNTLDANNIKT